MKVLVWWAAAELQPSARGEEVLRCHDILQLHAASSGTRPPVIVRFAFAPDPRQDLGIMTADELRDRARSLPSTSEAVACAGTAVESTSFRVGRKAYLFVGQRDVRLKLGPSLAEAASHPAARVGAHGWVTVALDALPDSIMDWVRESHYLVGGG